MKKILLFLPVLFFPCFVQAQSAYDALRYSRIFYLGTARSASMGNAMTALGGDFGALSINPAGSAVYPYTEFTFTPVLHNAVTQSDYLSSQFENTRTCFDVANLGYVSSFKTSNYSGLASVSFGFGYNALQNFTDRLSVSGETDQSSWLAALASNTNGIFAQDMDQNSSQNPFHNGSLPWKAILAWNASLLDTIPGSRGTHYKAATETLYGESIFIPGTLGQNYSRESSGNVGEYVINMGLNFSHQFFIGANIGIQSISYKYKEYYSEKALYPHDFAQTQFGSFTHTYNQTTTGVGLNLKVGFIYLPVKNVRLGAAISTPTWMRLREEWEERITADFMDGYGQSLTSPLGEYEYKVNTPFRWNAGIAYTFGEYGAVSIDYERTAYNKIYMGSSDFNNPFTQDNSFIKKEFQPVSSIRAGLEFNLNDGFSLRGGYAYHGSPERNYTQNIHIASLGIGLHMGTFSTDLAFINQFPQKEYFSLYDDVIGYEPAPVGTQTIVNWKLLLTLGMKF